MVNEEELPVVPEMRLKQLVPVPVSDVDRAKAFYQRGWFRQYSRHPGERHDEGGVRVTPPGFSCAIVFGTGMGPITDMAAGVGQGAASGREGYRRGARRRCFGRGVDVGEVADIGGVKYAWFSDPDGNLWGLQQWPAGYEA